MEADKVHLTHALIEQVNADLKDSALAHLPCGNFAANSARLVAAVMAYNVARTAGILAQCTFQKPRMNAIRTTLVNVPARIVSSARRIKLLLPESWPWQTT
ncbi:transposase [Arthrobacter sp. H35-D1]|uniref:transposase n=1 Tax=Arthrobacter sp. H35-D1 TaxID=3046202 RepID=UPI0024BA2F22|nr:transposase [Arthrobacter sp. H35-D1]MDJ0315477.1 transposase [Arthrobacter sp. H35-D1]